MPESNNVVKYDADTQRELSDRYNLPVDEHHYFTSIGYCRDWGKLMLDNPITPVATPILDALTRKPASSDAPPLWPLLGWARVPYDHVDE